MSHWCYRSDDVLWIMLCSCFGKAFEQASKVCNVQAVLDSFDSNCEWSGVCNVIIYFFLRYLAVLVLQKQMNRMLIGIWTCGAQGTICIWHARISLVRGTFRSVWACSDLATVDIFNLVLYLCIFWLSWGTSASWDENGHSWQIVIPKPSTGFISCLRNPWKCLNLE